MELESWGRASSELHGQLNNAAATNAEMLNVVLSPSMYISKLLLTLESLQKSGKCPDLAVRKLPSGQLAAKVRHRRQMLVTPYS